MIFGYNRWYRIIGFKRGRVESGCELMMYDEKRTGGAGMVEKEEFYLNSTNGVNKLHVISWHPLEEIRAIVQISHGMCEYVDRYDRLATFLAQHAMIIWAMGRRRRMKRNWDIFRRQRALRQSWMTYIR